MIPVITIYKSGNALMDIRPPARPSYIRNPPRDNSGERLKAVLIIASVLFGGMVFFGTNKSPDEAAQVTQPLPQEPMPVTPPAAAPIQTLPPAVQRSYSPPVAATRPTEQDWSRFHSMQSYCYRMAEMNSTGEYPALQQSACGDFARFAASANIDPGQLPDVLVRQEAPRQAQAQTRSYSSARQPPAECASLQRQRDSIHARTRQQHSAGEAEYYRQKLRDIDARMWDLNCRNH